MDTIFFAADEDLIAVLTVGKQLVWRTTRGDMPMESMPVPPVEHPEYADKLRMWRSAALLKWGMAQVVGADGADMPHIENGSMPKLVYDGKMRAYRIQENK